LNQLLLILSLVVPTLAILGSMIFLWKRTPILIQQVLNDVGADISKTIQNQFLDPQVKKMYSEMGKKSGEVRADTALRSKVATQIVDEIPSVKFLLDQFDIEPVEALKLMNDPLFAPIIQGFLGKYQKDQPQGQGQGQGQQRLGVM